MERKGTAGSWERARRAQTELDELTARVALARDARDVAVWALAEQGAGSTTISRGVGVDEATIRRAVARVRNGKIR